MRWLIVIAILGCSSDEPPQKTSHPAMPNQFEVGSTINGTYRVVKKLGEAGDHAVFAVEHVRFPDRTLTLIAPQLRDATLNITEVDRTPGGKTFVVAELTDAQLRDVLAGTHDL